MSSWFSRREWATKANLSERERAFHVAMRSPGRNEEGGSEEDVESCAVGKIVEADVVSCEKPAGSTRSRRELIGRQICALNSVFLSDRVGRNLSDHNERKLSVAYLTITMLGRNR